MPTSARQLPPHQRPRDRILQGHLEKRRPQGYNNVWKNDSSATTKSAGVGHQPTAAAAPEREATAHQHRPKDINQHQARMTTEEDASEPGHPHHRPLLASHLGHPRALNAGCPTPPKRLRRLTVGCPLDKGSLLSTSTSTTPSLLPTNQLACPTHQHLPPCLPRQGLKGDGQHRRHPRHSRA